MEDVVTFKPIIFWPDMRAWHFQILFNMFRLQKAPFNAYSECARQNSYTKRHRPEAAFDTSGMTMKLKKSSFNRSNVQFLGHMVVNGGMSVVQGKVNAIKPITEWIFSECMDITEPICLVIPISPDHYRTWLKVERPA